MPRAPFSCAFARATAAATVASPRAPLLVPPLPLPSRSMPRAPLIAPLIAPSIEDAADRVIGCILLARAVARRPHLLPPCALCSSTRGECPPNGPLMLAANHARTALTCPHTMQRHPVNRHHRATRTIASHMPAACRRRRYAAVTCPPLVAAAVTPPSHRRRRVAAVASPPLAVAVDAALHQPAHAHHCRRTPLRTSLSPLPLPPLLPCRKPLRSPASTALPARTLHSHCRVCLSLVQRCSALRNHPVQPPSPLATACRPRNRRTPPPPPMTQQGPSPPSLASRASLKIHHLEAETTAVASIGANARADALSARTPRGCWQALAATVRFACASPAACTHRPKLAPPRWNHRCCEHWRIRWANAL